MKKTNNCREDEIVAYLKEAIHICLANPSGRSTCGTYKKCVFDDGKYIIHDDGISLIEQTCFKSEQNVIHLRTNMCFPSCPMRRNMFHK